jgi:hypothetical protein
MKTPNTIKAISLIVLGMLAFFATTNVTRGFDSMDGSNSREVLQRLSLTKETQDNIDSIFNTYADRIAECNRAAKAALDVRQAKQDEQDANKKWADAIHERDAAIRKALPPELTGKFDHGMELVSKRQEEYLKAYKDELDSGEKTNSDAKPGQNAEDFQKKLQDITDQYNKQLDAEVGKVKETNSKTTNGKP